MNRLMRRMRRFGRGGRSSDVQKGVIDSRTPQDVTSVRAKSEGHGKKTADKWNQ